MQNIIVNKERKKLSLNKVIIGFIISILVLTFASKSIYNILLPSVEVANFKAGRLEYNFYESGQLDYTDKSIFYSEGEYKIEEVFISYGSNVEKGAKIAKVNMTSINNLEKEKNLEIGVIENEIKQLENNNNENEKNIRLNRDKIETYNNEYESISTNPMYEGYDEKNLEVQKENILNEISLLRNYISESENVILQNNNSIKVKKQEAQLKRNEIEALKKGLDSEGNLLSPYAGKVVNVKCESGKLVQANEEICEIASEQSGVCASWKSLSKDGEGLNVDDDVELSIDGLTNQNALKGKVLTKKYNEEEDIYEFTASINQQYLQNSNIQVGRKLTVNYFNESESYDYIVPKECVYDGDNNSKIMYAIYEKDGAFGKITYIKKAKVKILAEDNYSYAISVSALDFDKFVLSCSKTISDGMEVKVK